MTFRVLSIRVHGAISSHVRSEIRTAIGAESGMDTVVIDLIDATNPTGFVKELLGEAPSGGAAPALRVITKNDDNILIHSSTDHEVASLASLRRPSPTIIEGVQWDEIVLPDDRNGSDQPVQLL